jgi:hypothetical protein
MNRWPVNDRTIIVPRMPDKYLSLCGGLSRCNWFPFRKASFSQRSDKHVHVYSLSCPMCDLVFNERVLYSDRRLPAYRYSQGAPHPRTVNQKLQVAPKYMSCKNTIRQIINHVWVEKWGKLLIVWFYGQNIYTVDVKKLNLNVKVTKDIWRTT